MNCFRALYRAAEENLYSLCGHQSPYAYARLLGRVLILKERLPLIDFLWGYATLLNRRGVQP